MPNSNATSETRTGAIRLLAARRESTFAAQQIELWLGRIFSLALLLSVAETVINALSQAPLLKPEIFWPTLTLIVATVVGMVLSHWFFNASSIWYLLHFLAVTVTILTWPLQVVDATALPANYTPWVWWQLGMSTLSAGFGLSLGLATFFVIGTPLYFLFLHLLTVGGSATVLAATQDAIYSILFSATFVSVVYLLRLGARNQDEANAEVQDQAVVEATQEAMENERLHVAEMMHNQVLGALQLAGGATSKKEKLESAAIAKRALEKLNEVSAWPTQEEQSVGSDSLFSALGKTLENQAPWFVVSTSSTANLELPLEVATALTEATMQAVNNSLIHAGGQAVRRKVSLKANPTGIKIVVSDDGRGFRMSRVPKNRMGIRTLMMRRMESVGGFCHIDAGIGNGAKAILEWGPDAK